MVDYVEMLKQSLRYGSWSAFLWSLTNWPQQVITGVALYKLWRENRPKPAEQSVAAAAHAAKQKRKLNEEMARERNNTWNL